MLWPDCTSNRLNTPQDFTKQFILKEKMYFTSISTSTQDILTIPCDNWTYVDTEFTKNVHKNASEFPFFLTFNTYQIYKNSLP